jgi:hypothetical protein
MLDYDNLASWSVEELRQQLTQILPRGWTFEQGNAEGTLWIRLLDPQGKVIWDTLHLDERTLLLDAYCWFGLRDQPRPTPETSVWGRRRGELTQRGVTQQVLSVPDPEDLDPKEVRLVYESAIRKRR